MRIRDISGDRLQLVRLHDSHAQIKRSCRSACAAGRDPQSGLDARRATGRSNGSIGLCARGRGQGQPRGGRKTSRTVRPRDSRGLRGGARAVRRLARAYPGIMAGERKMFEVFEVASPTGTAGLAFDLSETEALRAEMERHVGAYKGMLDQLSTAVAIFDRAKRLDLLQRGLSPDSGRSTRLFSSSGRPTAKSSTDLRAKRQLPEQADFRSWKAQTLRSLQGDRPGRDRLASARRPRVARRRQPQRRGRRHLSLRRRDAELRARLAVQRAHPRAGRDARRVEGGRRGVRRGRTAEARQPRLRRDLWRIDPRRGAQRARISTKSRATVCRC